MLKWFGSEDAGSSPGAGESAGKPTLSEETERLAQMEQLVSQLKEMIREKDAALHTKDEQLKAEKEACEAKLSKMRLQNKAKVTSLNSQLEALRKQQGQSPHLKRTGSGESGESEHTGASRGKILLLKKKVEDLEQQLAQRNQELHQKTKEMEAQRERGAEMDVMLVEKDKRLAEKEDYIIHLQMALGGETAVKTEAQTRTGSKEASLQELEMLVQNLTRKVGDGEEKYSLLKEQSDSLKELLGTERAQFEEKENMYKQNIQTFKDIILQKDNRITEMSQLHEQELFKLAAKSDASADLEQLLKALKQKLHEKEEVLLGKTQVIDVLQGEVDGRDQQIQELNERLRRLQSEKENLQSKMDAEKHIMRTQVRDLMEKHQEELKKVTEKYEREMSEKEMIMMTSSSVTTSADLTVDPLIHQKLLDLEAQAKLKAEEDSKSEAKFLKMKAWSKSRIRQLEDELKKVQSGNAAPDVGLLRTRVSELEEEREELLCKLEQYNELKAKNDVLEAKLVVYEEQQRKMQADLEQVTKRAASQTSESGSMDDAQSQVMEWQDMMTMVAEAEAARNQIREEKNVLEIRMSHIEEEREALASRQRELEEELSQARGLRPQRCTKTESSTPRNLQGDFEFNNGSSFPDSLNPSGSITPMEGENMGGWWPEFTASNTEGLRSVVEELELERNQLQEQILGLEERCQDLEDRLQLQARIESLQNESEKLQAQLSSLRSQQTRDAEKHQLLVTSLNEQLKGFNSTQEFLESSLMEKEHTLAQTSEKLELIDSLKAALKEKEEQHKDVADKLLQTENNLSEVSSRCGAFEKQCTEMKATVAELMQKLNVLKEKTQRQEATIESLQSDLDQTNDELDKLNSTHLEERAQLIHDLQSCEREIDSLKDIIADKDKEITALSGNSVEYAEQIQVLQQDIRHKEEDLIRIESALVKAEQEARIIRESQSFDQHSLNMKIAELAEQLRVTENDLNKARNEREANLNETKELFNQLEEDKLTIQDLNMEIQKLHSSQSAHLTECETQITSLKQQMLAATQKLQNSEDVLAQLKESTNLNESLKEQILDCEQTHEKEMKTLKEERNKLLADVTKYNDELQALSTQLQAQVECQEQVKLGVEEKLETITSLEEKLRDVQENSVEVKKELQKELAGNADTISKLEIMLKSLQDEKLGLQKSLEENSQTQMQLLQESQKKLDFVQNQNVGLQSQVDNLTKEKHALKQEVKNKVQSLQQLAEEKDMLLSKTEELESQQVETRNMVKDLIKDKEKLNDRATELEQSSQSLSEHLLVKAGECSQLKESLENNKEQVGHLQCQIEALNVQVNQLNCKILENEMALKEKSTQIDTQWSQIIQLHESLNSGELEKDSLLHQTASQFTSLQSELEQQRNLSSALQTECDSLREECNQLRQSLQEQTTALSDQTHECQSHLNELDKRDASLTSLSSQLGALNELNDKLEAENGNMKQSLEDLLACKKNLTEEIALRQANIIELHNNIQALGTQNLQIRALYENKEKELAELSQVVSEMDKKVATTLEEKENLASQISILSEQNSTHQKEQEKLTKERTSLNDKISGLEMQHAENCKIIEGLLKDKVELGETVKQTQEAVLEKNTECESLSKQLQDSKESVNRLNEQLKISDSQFNFSFAEKDQVISDLHKQLLGYQDQLTQLQETLSLLQEQGSALKSGLLEKDSVLQQQSEECSSLQCELGHQRELFANLQTENKKFEEKCSQLLQELKIKENECCNHTDELNKRNESLSNQLAMTNDNVARLFIDNKNLKHSLEYHLAENATLKESLTEKQVELINFQDNVQALNEANSTLKAELQKSAREIFSKQEEICALQSQLSSKDADFTDLMQQVATEHSKAEKLHLEQQQREESFKKQETLLSKLQVRFESGEDQISQKMEAIAELQMDAQNLQRSLQEKDVLLLKKEQEITELCEKITAESEVSKARMKSDMDVISKLQGDIQGLLEKIDGLSAALAEKDALLKTETEQQLSMKTSAAKLENAISQLTCETQGLSSETAQLGSALAEKDQALLDTKSKHSAELSSLKETLKVKDLENHNMKQELSQLKETVLGLNRNLSDQFAEITRLKATLTENDCTVVDKTKALHDLQRKADEAALFKSQFMESTELVSELQSQNQALKEESTWLSIAIDEKQSAFTNLKDKFALQVEELEEVKNLLSEKNEESSKLSQAIMEGDRQIHTLQQESSSLKNEVQQLQSFSAEVSKQKDEALVAQQTNANSLTVEIKRLKEEHLQVAAQVNSLTENLEQRELALHAINSQYAAQVMHTEHAVSEVQKMNELCNKLQEENLLTKQELDQRKADEAALFKSQFMESTELVSELQSQNQALKEESTWLSIAIDEKQSAFTNLKDKFALQVEELEEVKNLLSQKNEESSKLSQAIMEGDRQIHTLQQESSSLKNEVQQLQSFSAEVSKQKDEALVAQQTNANSLTVEIKRLKEEHLQVAAQVNSLTENLEQRELALHAINSQYAAQVMHTEHAVSEVQKMNELCNKLQEENLLTKQELDRVNNEKTQKEEEVHKLVLENEVVSRNYSYEIQRTQEQLQHQSLQQHGSMERMKTEMEQLQVQVSAKDDIITGLKSEVQRVEQTLQESEKEWLSLLDRETQAKNVLAKQLQEIEHELTFKDSKVHVLKQDLDQLNKNLAEATLAIEQGAERLKEKEMDNLMSRSKLEDIIFTVQFKDRENIEIRQALRDKQMELKKIVESQEYSQNERSRLTLCISEKEVAFNDEKVSLQSTIEQLQKEIQSKESSFKQELAELNRQLEQRHVEGLDNKSETEGKIALLSESIKELEEKLRTEIEKSETLQETSLKHNTLVKKKDKELSCMSIQISQQKELLTALSQQLKVKDASITQVVASASNERIKYEEQINNLISQLEEAKETLSLCQGQMENTVSDNKDLVKDNNELQTEISKVTKEKEAIKKKLQASLVVRKELLKKIEEHEKQHVESAENKIEVSVLQKKSEELTMQTNSLIKKHDATVSELIQQLKDKDSKINELLMLMSEKEHVIVRMEDGAHGLQGRLKEQEERLVSTLQKLEQQKQIIDQLQIASNVQDVAFKNEKQILVAKLEKDVMTNKNATSERLHHSEELESELAKVQKEKSDRQKKAHAALLARKKTQENQKMLNNELCELKANFTSLQENHNQQTQEFMAVHSSYEVKVQELQCALQNSKCVQDKVEALEGVIEEREAAIQHLRATLETQSAQASSVREELKCLNQNLENVKSELAHKDELLVTLQEQFNEITGKSSELAKEITKKNDEIATQKAYIQTTEQQLKDLQQSMTKLQTDYQNQLDILKVSFEEKCSSAFQEDLSLKQKLEMGTIEMTHKDELLLKLEEESKEMFEKSAFERSEFVKEIHEKNQEIERQKLYNQTAEGQLEKFKENMAKLESENLNQSASFKELQRSGKAAESEECKKNKMQNEIERLQQERDVITAKLETALQMVTQKSEQIHALQDELTVARQQVFEQHSQCQKAQSEVEQMKLVIETIQGEKESCMVDYEKSRQDYVQLESQLKQFKTQNNEHLVKAELTDKASDEKPSVLSENSKMTCVHQPPFKEGAFQSLLLEKEALISALEQQIQRQIHLHEVEMEKMRIEVSERQQKPAEVGNNKSVDQLTKKLQAALISRKEILKNNRALTEEIQKLQLKNECAQSEMSTLESVISDLRPQKNELETKISTLSTEKQNLARDVDQILSDNHNLSAACESLKLTIENITQQKQAFSCQLESLKDSQTEELSEWKSKHADLKQEYESLLQAYENVSSEMDKMRQLLEVAKRERQEALLKYHKYESEKNIIDKQIADLEEENYQMKEKMRRLAKLKQQKIEELEAEIEQIRKDLVSSDDEPKCTVEELTLKNGQLESEIKSIKQDNQILAKELKQTSLSLEKWHQESESTEGILKVKLSEALSLNENFTAQMENQKTDLAVHFEMVALLQKENSNLAEKLKLANNDHEGEVSERDKIISNLQQMIEKNAQETINLSEKVKILEDDKCMLQEELENVQETSDKVKNENEYLETMLLKNSERIDELTDTVNVLQTQKMQLSAQLMEVKENKAKVCQEKEQLHLKLVKEFEEKLKALQRGTEGSKNMRKELQELLKEKHQEINQLQQDCIKYQELILNLERSLKYFETQYQQIQKELRDMTEKVTDLQKEKEKFEKELKTHKNILNETEKELSRVTSEKDALEQKLAQRQEQALFESEEKEKTLEKMAVQQQALLKEQRAELQRQINDLQEQNKQKAQVILSLHQQLESKDLQLKTIQREAETNSAKLAVFSVDPNTGSNAEQWESVFQNVLHDKDSQLREQSLVIAQLSEDNREKARVLNDMQISNRKLEKTLNEYTVAAAAHQRQLFVMRASNTELNQNLEILTKRSIEQCALIERLVNDKSTLVKQVDEQKYSISQIKTSLEHSLKMLADKEPELLEVQARNSKLLVDLEKQEAISLHLKSLIQSKDSEISSLLSSKDGQLSGYLEQLQANHSAQLAGYENRLTALYTKQESYEKEAKALESKVQGLQARLDRCAQEKEQLMINVSTLRNSVLSVQSEKEQLMLELKQIKERGKEESADSLTKSLKQEIRTLLHQMDDLNSENAMLKAQLIRYREDLNQVLSLKDNQLKDLLKKQQDSIRNLEIQKQSVEMHHRDALLEVQKEAEEIKALNEEKAKLHFQVQELQDSLSALQKERQEANESKVIADLQQAIAAKASECNELQQKLFAQKVSAYDLNKSLKEKIKESEIKLAEAEDKYNNELNAFEREFNVLRNERETADQRVADLARERLQAEQELSEGESQNKNLKSQNESLGKAMAALQNDRDQLIDEFKILRSRYDEELREATASINKFERQLNDSTSEISALSTEKNALVQKLLALESKSPHSKLSALVDNLSQAVSEKEGQLKQASLEKSSYSRQVNAFSKAMVSLQSDRDRLIEELRKTKREVEHRQQTSSKPVESVKSEDSNNLSINVGVLQTERDGLFKEIGNLRSQNAEQVELKQKYDDLQRALQQAHTYKQQCEKDVLGYQAELTNLRSEKSQLQSECQALRESSKASGLVSGKGTSSDQVVQLQTHLQRCMVEIQQRDLGFQQLNLKLQQAVEEKAAVSAQLRAVSQTLRETQLSLSELQNRYYWIANQQQIQHPPAQASVCAEVAPGAPQEISSTVSDLDGLDIRELKTRLVEAELQLDSTQQNVSLLNDRLEEERVQRQAAEATLGLVEQRINSMERSPSRSSQHDFSIQLETEEEWEALILDPKQHLLMRTMKSSVHSCRRWLRGRSLYCSKMLTSRAKSRYFFLIYLLALHILIFMCFTGVL